MNEDARGKMELIYACASLKFTNPRQKSAKMH